MLYVWRLWENNKCVFHYGRFNYNMNFQQNVTIQFAHKNCQNQTFFLIQNMNFQQNVTIQFAHRDKLSKSDILSDSLMGVNIFMKKISHPKEIYTPFYWNDSDAQYISKWHHSQWQLVNGA